MLIGNPASNPKIWELYKEVITGKKNQSTEKTTQIEVNKTEHDFGKIKNKTENACFFTLTNNGENDLIIHHVSVSCGCTGVEWKKQPVKPGATTQIKVKMTPEQSGYFNKTVDVHCNVTSGLIKLVVKGEAE